ncbi:MAG: hypothetical protein QOE35_1486 [Actinomycetota bacterium]|jgi:uncharacterized membrane protein
MRRFTVRPVLTLKGRTFKGLRGWSGKPLHPPLTDIPIGAYVIAAGLDVISAVGGAGHHWSRELWHAGTFVFVAGAAVSLPTALTGYWDWLKSTQKGTQARRTANTHAWIMLTVTTLTLVDLALRLSQYHTKSWTPVPVLVLSLLVAGLVSIGATFGGSLVYEYGFNVETAGDHPVWHPSETDVFPGDH